MLTPVPELILFETEVVTKKSESSLCLGKVNHYFDVVSISVVEFIDKHRNDNQRYEVILKTDNNSS